MKTRLMMCLFLCCMLCGCAVQAPNKDPEFGNDAYWNWIQLAQDAPDSFVAHKMFERAVEVAAAEGDDHKIRALMSFADYCHIQGNDSEAAELLRNALVLWKQEMLQGDVDADWYFGRTIAEPLAYLLDRLNRSSEAESAMKDYVNFCLANNPRPEYDPTCLPLVYHYIRCHQPDEEYNFLKSICGKVDTGLGVQVETDMAEILIRQDKMSEAKKLLDSTSDLVAEGLLAKAWVCERSHDSQGARRAYQQCADACDQICSNESWSMTEFPDYQHLLMWAHFERQQGNIGQAKQVESKWEARWHQQPRKTDYGKAAIALPERESREFCALKDCVAEYRDDKGRKQSNLLKGAKFVFDNLVRH